MSSTRCDGQRGKIWPRGTWQRVLVLLQKLLVVSEDSFFTNKFVAIPKPTVQENPATSCVPCWADISKCLHFCVNSSWLFIRTEFVDTNTIAIHVMFQEQTWDYLLVASQPSLSFRAQQRETPAGSLLNINYCISAGFLLHIEWNM